MTLTTHTPDPSAAAAAENVSKLTYWILGGLLTGVVALAGLALAHLQAQISALTTLEVSRRERLGALESSARAADARISALDTALDRRLSRIESKLDEVLAARR